MHETKYYQCSFFALGFGISNYWNFEFIWLVAPPFSANFNQHTSSHSIRGLSPPIITNLLLVHTTQCVVIFPSTVLTSWNTSQILKMERSLNDWYTVLCFSLWSEALHLVKKKQNKCLVQSLFHWILTDQCVDGNVWIAKPLVPWPISLYVHLLSTSANRLEK
jgi:hypothetical protein